MLQRLKDLIEQRREDKEEKHELPAGFWVDAAELVLMYVVAREGDKKVTKDERQAIIAKLQRMLVGLATPED